MSTGHRKVALVAVVEPRHLVTLDVTCRTCSRCDLLIAHQTDVSTILAEVFREHDPSVIGNPYVIAGTMARADWQQVAERPLTVEQTAQHVRPFAEVVS